MPVTDEELTVTMKTVVQLLRDYAGCELEPIALAWKHRMSAYARSKLNSRVAGEAMNRREEAVRDLASDGLRSRSSRSLHSPRRNVRWFSVPHFLRSRSFRPSAARCKTCGFKAGSTCGAMLMT